MNDENHHGESSIPETITFHYIKGNYFRVIHTDGVVGGILPSGIQMVIFSQRMPIPQQVEHSINADGSIGEELPEKRIGKAGVVRELEANLLMDMKAAEQIHSWLGKRIEDWKAISQAHVVSAQEQ